MEGREDDEGATASWLSEVSPVTLIVSAITILAVVGYALVLIVEMFL